MSQYGINVPPGIPAKSLDEVKDAVKKMADEDDVVVIKAQILAGGRGLGKFTNGLQGGVHVAKAGEAVELAKKMLNGTLVTKQVRSAATSDSAQPLGQDRMMEEGRSVG